MDLISTKHMFLFKKSACRKLHEPKVKERSIKKENKKKRKSTSCFMLGMKAELSPRKKRKKELRWLFEKIEKDSHPIYLSNGNGKMWDEGHCLQPL